MSGATRKMVNLSIEETSGVDHPAHLHEGWLVMKAASPEAVDEALTIRKDETAPGSDDPSLKPNEQEAPVDNEDVNVTPESGEDVPAAVEAPVEADAAQVDNGEDILKSAPEAVRKMLTDMQKAADEAVAKAAVAEAELRKERDERADEASIAKARADYAHLGIDAEKVGPALRRLAGFDADLAKSVEEVLVAANAKSESSNLFAEIGKSASGTVGDAYEQATGLAKAAVADGRSDTFAQALTDVFASKPDLYTQYLADQGK